MRAISGIQAGPAALPARGHANTNVNRAGKPPLAPTNLKAAATQNGVLLQFTKVAEAADYLVFRKSPGESNWNFVAATKTPRFSHELDVSGKLFFYAVRARGTNGVESELSKPVGFSLATDKSLFKTRSAHALLPTGALNGSYAGSFYGANGKQTNFTLEIRAAGYGSEILLGHSGKAFKTAIAGITEPQRILTSGFEIIAAKGNYHRLFISCRQKSACGQPFRDTAIRVR